jgi:predicted phage terminase large subunit-like protein
MTKQLSTAVKYKSRVEDEDILRGFVLSEARNNPNTCIEAVMNDERGEPLLQGEMHEELQDFLSAHKRGVIEEPREHGKTTQIVGRSIYEIGRDLTIRIKIISNAEDEAVKRGKAIREFLERKEYKAIFPHVKPGREWTDSRFSVRRSTVVPESTVECKGINSKGTGGRSDLMFFDDPDDEEVVTSEVKRKRNWERIANVWLNTLTPQGRAYLIATPWHKKDCAHQVKKNGWPSLRRPIKKMIPIWPERWNKSSLAERKKDIGSLAFARGYELVPLSADSAPIKAAWVKFWDQLPKLSSLVIVCDPAISLSEKADYTCIGVIGVTRDYKVFLLEVIRDRMNFPDTVKILTNLSKAMHIKYKIRPIIGVESVAYQMALPQQVRLETPYPVRSISTSKSKFVRMSRFAVHVEQGRVHLYGRDGVVHKSQEIVFDEIIGYPAEEYDDAADMMALGTDFALECARMPAAAATSG